MVNCSQHVLLFAICKKSRKKPSPKNDGKHFNRASDTILRWVITDKELCPGKIKLHYRPRSWLWICKRAIQQNSLTLAYSNPNIWIRQGNVRRCWGTAPLGHIPRYAWSPPIVHPWRWLKDGDLIKINLADGLFNRPVPVKGPMRIKKPVIRHWTIAGK